MDWRKSSYSSDNGSQCVECRTDADAVLIRDTTDRDGCTLTVTASAWLKFTGTLK
jgi:hypothetical protein